MACLRPAPGEVVVDCTVGYGGHAREFLQRIAPGGKLIGLDVDAAELERTRRRLGRTEVPVSFYHSNFAGLAKVLGQEKLDGFDIIFADLGVSSMQIDDPERGMSYKHEGPLDMRMDDRLQQTGADLLKRLSEEELSKALWELADEPDHQKIARQIVARRAVEPITRTSQLVQVVFDAKGLDPKTLATATPRAQRPAPCTRPPARSRPCASWSTMSWVLCASCCGSPPTACTPAAASGSSASTAAKTASSSSRSATASAAACTRRRPKRSLRRPSRKSAPIPAAPRRNSAGLWPVLRPPPQAEPDPEMTSSSGTCGFATPTSASTSLPGTSSFSRRSFATRSSPSRCSRRTSTARS